ncbi:MAG: tetrahydromethanopterin S-methyltransferase subunit H [Candidatus Bathyarchaeota archaeon]|nr:tetrahydromethanopterin S-methyltransferase subunit H [Candidatus Bathyarchaeota archaeon]MDD4325230.1 tetrahydromethanopterin S-methyltransferase subunit H [Candidatus Bathyarchaeota archaeon]MDI9578252.1 tetrahydromethanopterin S-methyltransferase subunit H [Thermoproteota archaeon]MDT8782876.1 tetrahydromethanopterin S-methyltransferase subunit H [Candidatus Bathyarchaeota archaeon]NLD65844.1 tetrahydromethanopterin S-methyltransferase subunit H [Thermoproteota archaeon]
MSFKFNTPQKIYDICDAKIGGQPGELPTFLIGSIFWLGQKMVQDANKGIFDEKAAEDLINTIQTQSDITGVKFALDIVGTTETAFEKYIDFVPKHTDAPLMLDAMSPRTRMAAANLAKKMGLADRCLYNSIYKGVTDAELANIKESGIKMSIVLADDPKDTTLEGKMNVIVEALAMAERAGITKPLIDTAIPAFEPDMGASVRAIPIMKEKYGHPVGLGSGNVVTTMGWVKANVAKQFRKGTVTATNTIMQMAGANWLMFGPAEQAEWVFPAIAVTDTYLASAAADLGTRPLEETHPIYKAFM